MSVYVLGTIPLKDGGDANPSLLQLFFDGVEVPDADPPHAFFLAALLSRVTWHVARSSRLTVE